MCHITSNSFFFSFDNRDNWPTYITWLILYRGKKSFRLHKISECIISLNSNFCTRWSNGVRPVVKSTMAVVKLTQDYGSMVFGLWMNWLRGMVDLNLCAVESTSGQCFHFLWKVEYRFVFFFSYIFSAPFSDRISSINFNIQANEVAVCTEVFK